MTHPFSTTPLDVSRRGSTYETPHTIAESAPLPPIPVPRPVVNDLDYQTPYAPIETRPYVAAEDIGQGFVDESAWWQATMNIAPPLQHHQHPHQHPHRQRQQNPHNQQFQFHEHQTPPGQSKQDATIPRQNLLYPAYDATVYHPESTAQASSSSQPYQIEATGVYVAQPGTFDPQYPQQEMYSASSIEGYQPGIVHEGVYLPMSIQHTPSPLPTAIPLPTYDQTLGSNLYATPQSSTHQHTNMFTQSYPETTGHIIQQHYLNNAAIPSEDHRPSNHRSTSTPLHRHTNKITSPEIMTPTTINSGSTTTTVNVSVPEEEKHASHMGVMFTQTPPDPVSRLSERLGEFLMGPSDSPSAHANANPTGPQLNPGHGAGRKRKTQEGTTFPPQSTLAKLAFESDGLTEGARNTLCVSTL